MQFKALLMPRVVRFILISTIRLVGIIAICLVIGAEVQEIVRNIQGYVHAVHGTKSLTTSAGNTTSFMSSSIFSATSTSLSSDFPTPTSISDVFEPTPTDDSSSAEPTNSEGASDLAKRTLYAYAALPANDNTTTTNTTLEGGQGYVIGTTVPSHAGGIVFSTLFRILNVLILFFLLVSEISPPMPVVTKFYLTYFHPLSEDSSVGFLGAAMIWLATAILSTNVQQFALISAWLLFVIGVLNVIVGLIMGPSIREHRSIFASDRTTRPLLPTSSDTKSKNKKSKVSYPAPIVDIGFPAPAAGNKDSIGFSFAGGAFDAGAYAHAQQQLSGENWRPSEMLERGTLSPVQPLNTHSRARSGKGVVTIRTPAEEEEVARELAEKEVMQPPSYVYGKARSDAGSSHAH